jgi:hypothetical protein
MRLFAILGLSLSLLACGVKAAPRPPRPDARPQTGDPNMVRTNAPRDTAPAAVYPVEHNPSFPGGVLPWQRPPNSPELGRETDGGQPTPEQEREK